MLDFCVANSLFVMAAIKNVTVLGVSYPPPPPRYLSLSGTVTYRPTQASGNFGAPITNALIRAGFDVTAITRADSPATFPPGMTVFRVDYQRPDELTKAFEGQDAVVCVLGNHGLLKQNVILDAAEAAGVRRFILNDFGWGRDFRGIPEFDIILDGFKESREHARAKAAANPSFTYTGITISVCLDFVSGIPFHQLTWA